MSSKQPLTVVLVERQAAPERHFSIERVFDSVARHAPADCALTRVNVPVAGVGAGALLRNMRSVRGLRADVVHVTGDVHYVLLAVRRRAKRVLTVHDLASLRRSRGWRRWVIRTLWYTLPIRAADVVTTVSEETRRQLVSEFGWAGSKVTVVENPLGHPFDRGGFEPQARDDGGEPVVLAVGTAANKNLMATARAAQRAGVRLRVIGRVDTALATALDFVGGSWSATHSISDDDLLLEYLRADVLVFPSLHEGFGLPIVEAQAVGLPVITSDLAPMNQVGGGAAVLVDPNNPGGIAVAIRAVIEDHSLREQLIRDGYENAARRAPDRVSEGYAVIYRRLLERSPS